MPHAEINVPGLILVGRFSGDPHWPVLGDPWGPFQRAGVDAKQAPQQSIPLGFAKSSHGVLVFLRGGRKKIRFRRCGRGRA